MTVTKCDKCGKEFRPEEVEGTHFIVQRVHPAAVTTRLDLCSEHMKQLVAFLENPETTVKTPSGGTSYWDK